MHTIGRNLARLELIKLENDLAATERAWRALAGTLSPVQLNWRPAPNRWSVGQHLVHLNLVDASYLSHLDAMIARGRAESRLALGRPRHPWLGRRLVLAAEPPVKVQLRTPSQYDPAPFEVDREMALLCFSVVRRSLRERIEAAAGLDPGRVRARFAPGIGIERFVTLSFGQWIALTAAHDRRHLWLAERVTESSGFPIDVVREWRGSGTRFLARTPTAITARSSIASNW